MLHDCAASVQHAPHVQGAFRASLLIGCGCVVRLMSPVVLCASVVATDCLCLLVVYVFLRVWFLRSWLRVRTVSGSWLRSVFVVLVCLLASFPSRLCVSERTVLCV